MQTTTAMARSATLHCLTGCAIGEIAGLILGTSLHWSNIPTVIISIVLAFIFGFGLSTMPLLKNGLPPSKAIPLVIAADSLSIATMEIVDNLVMIGVPGALDAGLLDILFWFSLALSIIAAFFAAYPVNKYLLERDKGHALVMPYHHNHHK